MFSFSDSGLLVCLHNSNTLFYFLSTASQSKVNKNKQIDKTHQVYLGLSWFTENCIQKGPFHLGTELPVWETTDSHVRGSPSSASRIHQHLFRLLYGTRETGNSTRWLWHVRPQKGWPMGFQVCAEWNHSFPGQQRETQQKTQKREKHTLRPLLSLIFTKFRFAQRSSLELNT